MLELIVLFANSPKQTFEMSSVELLTYADDYADVPVCGTDVVCRHCTRRSFLSSHHTELSVDVASGCLRVLQPCDIDPMIFQKLVQNWDGILLLLQDNVRDQDIASDQHTSSKSSSSDPDSDGNISRSPSEPILYWIRW